MTTPPVDTSREAIEATRGINPVGFVRFSDLLEIARALRTALDAANQRHVELHALTQAIIENANNDYAEAIAQRDAAIARADRLADELRWRSFKDDPEWPEFDSNIIVYNEPFGYCHIINFDHDSDKRYWIDHGLTHWRPLSPPTKDSPT